ncbi:hypothetical protein CH063_02568 [Colletotrichum higginsianum]|uniref:Uncharacterized protein n=1 Tax=Colletotrichum higginsianum (strain IMI 349063) TaxID=759273 RepID=H1VM63_COLHI|nr:hypothetical protein CH063_02568 [Colletotrichum higginsianum]
MRDELSRTNSFAVRSKGNFMTRSQFAQPRRVLHGIGISPTMSHLGWTKGLERRGGSQSQ